jgi:molybdopterin-containing oxidoreductase family iron-sulfur binding subunit
MVIDIDRCTGCGACVIACAAEYNVPPPMPSATARTGITPMRVQPIANGSAFIPLLCMQCEHETPCVSVCPQQAVEVDRATGIVTQMPQRCLGCRYCMTACPYHARYFNWWDPQWPPGMEKTLNPGVAVRMRGVVEKCNLCHARLHAAEDEAAAQKKDHFEYAPACVESCPTQALTFGDLANENSAVARAAHSPESFRLLEKLGTEPKVYYRSERAWVREMGVSRG